MASQVEIAGFSNRIINVVPTCSTGAMGANQVLFDRTIVRGATSAPDAPAILESVVYLDEDDTAAAAITLFFLDADVTLGSINEDPSITDANARNILGTLVLASASFVDFGAGKVCSALNVGMIVKPVAGTQDIYVAAITAGTGTQTVNGVKLRLGFKNF